jgi:hypothetical protein
VVVPVSDGFGAAPLQLQRTLTDALARETGLAPAAPSFAGQLAHLSFPFTVGEQGPLDRRGLPAVLVQVSGERGPAAAEAVSRERLEGFGRGVLSAMDAMDRAPDVSTAMQTGVLVQRKTFPAWALRLLVAALLLPPLIVAFDGLARARRRGRSVARWTPWVLACAAPFFLAAVFARVLGLSGVLGAAPATPVPPHALAVGGGAAGGVAAVALGLVLAWLLWPACMRRLRLGVRPDLEAAGLAMLLVLLCVCIWVWAVNPFAALLVLPAAHLWLAIVSPALRPRPRSALVLVAIGVLPAALLVVFYAHDLGLGAGQVLWTAVLLVAGGQIGPLGALVWSLALGCAAATAMLALMTPFAPARGGADEDREITIRGPITYAGPGSLGGTKSALRR